MNPLLTIAIPTYNGAKTICAMLDLLLPQCNEKTEVIVCDNCSTDGTGEIIHQYQRDYPFIQYVANPKNIGADGNFLKCMRMAKGRYVHLLSDDDILMEDSLERILSFLEQNPDMGLVHLSSADFRNKYVSRDRCARVGNYSQTDICTADKKVFMNYAKQYWGFLSSFIINKARFAQIPNPETYFGTYWLQSYIHILCAAGSDTKLGVVSGLCIGAGVYMKQSNLDVAQVDGVNYKQMLEFAIEQGFDRQQLEEWYIARICLLASHGIVKEKAIGTHSINRKLLFQCTRRYWQSWVRIYPVMCIPSFLCKLALGIKRKYHGADFRAEVNRVGDVGTEKEE